MLVARCGQTGMWAMRPCQEEKRPGGQRSGRRGPCVDVWLHGARGAGDTASRGRAGSGQRWEKRVSQESGNWLSWQAKRDHDGVALPFGRQDGLRRGHVSQPPKPSESPHPSARLEGQPIAARPRATRVSAASSQRVILDRYRVSDSLLMIPVLGDRTTTELSMPKGSRKAAGKKRGNERLRIGHDCEGLAKIVKPNSPTLLYRTGFVEDSLLLSWIAGITRTPGRLLERRKDSLMRRNQHL